MTRKRFGLITVCLLLALAAGGGAFMWAMSQVPDFYERALTMEHDPAMRKEAARELVQRTLHLVDEIKHAEAWSQEFDQQHVNSWLAEELHTKYADVVPPGVGDPRVRFVDDVVQVGFRFEQDGWNHVVSLRLKPWVPEPNQLAVEILSVRAGLIRIPLDNVLEEISRQIEAAGWQVEWKQANGNDVLVLHLDRGEPDQPVLDAVEVVEGKARIVGRRQIAGAGPKKPTSAPASTGESPKPPRMAGQSEDNG